MYYFLQKTRPVLIAKNEPPQYLLRLKNLLKSRRMNYRKNTINIHRIFTINLLTGNRIAEKENISY